MIKLTLFLLILLLYLNKNIPNSEYFITYDKFEYSDKLSNDNIIQLKKGQIKMGNMLKEFDKICQKHNVRYFLIAGSLIGALGYNGWIPWDGDVDLEVHEEDYTKLKNALKTELPKNMWFQNYETDKYYPKNNNIIGKVRDLNSCYIEYTNNGGTQWHNGLQIDVNIYKETDGKIYFPDDKKIDNLTYKDIYPLKRVIFNNGKDKFYVNVMNNSEKYLNQKFGRKWHLEKPFSLSKEKRYPHEGKVDGENTCNFHYKKYPNLYKK